MSQDPKVWRQRRDDVIETAFKNARDGRVSLDEARTYKIMYEMFDVHAQNLHIERDDDEEQES